MQMQALFDGEDYPNIFAIRDYFAVSRVENGLVDPTIGSFCAILSALGLRMDIVKSLA